jgi:hypothetical protein
LIDPWIRGYYVSVGIGLGIFVGFHLGAWWARRSWIKRSEAEFARLARDLGERLDHMTMLCARLSEELDERQKETGEAKDGEGPRIFPAG